MISKIEQEFVIDFYNNNASEFSSTRYAPWPLVKEFIESIPPGSLVLDVGCGNGKNQFRNDLIWTSCDASAEMCKLCNNAILAECTDLPFETNSFDAVICIAVIHHLDSSSKHVKAIKEIECVLKPNGKSLISVWAAQAKYGNGDQYIKWKSNDVLRYIHFFSESEIKALSKQSTIKLDYNNYYIYGCCYK